MFIVNKNKKTIQEGEQSIVLGTTELSMTSINETGQITGVTLIGLTGNVTWTSSNENVVRVTGNNESATVTAIGEGTAVITAHAGGKTATCNVTVNLGWVDNGDGTYTKGATTYSLGQSDIPTSAVLSALGIEPVSGKYNGTWTVIGMENNKIKLVSTSNLEEYFNLGYPDTRAKEANPAVNESSLTNAEKLKRAIWSFNNAVATLNSEAKFQTGIESARSINIEDIYKIVPENNVNKIDTYTGIFVYYWGNNKVLSKYFPEGTSDEEIEVKWDSSTSSRRKPN